MRPPAAHGPVVISSHALHAAAPPTAPASASAFLPHGYCYLWNKPLLLTYVTADLLIGVSYVVISIALATLIHRARRDIPFSVVFVAFGLFIITCGLTHFVEVWALWQPVYWLSGGVKAITAVASVATAAVLPFVLPRVHDTIRDAKSARAREVEVARAGALREQNARLEAQTVGIERQAAELADEREAAHALAAQLAIVNGELRHTEAEARRHFDALEATYQSAPVGLCELDEDLRSVRSNARLAEINGRSFEAHRGRIAGAACARSFPTSRRPRSPRSAACSRPASRSLAPPRRNRTRSDDCAPPRTADGRRPHGGKYGRRGVDVRALASARGACAAHAHLDAGRRCAVGHGLSTSDVSDRPPRSRG